MMSSTQPVMAKRIVVLFFGSESDLKAIKSFLKSDLLNPKTITRSTRMENKILK